MKAQHVSHRQLSHDRLVFSPFLLFRFTTGTAVNDDGGKQTVYFFPSMKAF